MPIIRADSWSTTKAMSVALPSPSSQEVDLPPVPWGGRGPSRREGKRGLTLPLPPLHRSHPPAPRPRGDPSGLTKDWE